MIAAHDEVYLFTHNLNTLLDQLRALGESVPLDAEDVTLINEFAVDWRYDEPNSVNTEQRARYIDVVSNTRMLVYTRVEVLRPGVDWVAAVAAARTL